jgi:hypothetical protein
VKDESVNESLSQAKTARAALSKNAGRVVGRLLDAPAGAYLENYAQCLLNRQIDIFDDALFLLEGGRIASACAISRGLIETNAFAKLLGSKVAETLVSRTGPESVDACLTTVLQFTNSSRFKQTEQKKVAKGIFDIDDYQFTEQASTRLLNSLATSEHVLDALRALFKEEMNHTGRKESGFEFSYDILSEWVHPSQTSIFHQYTPETHLIPTSVGPVHLHDAARLHCVRALHFITDSESVHTWLLELAKEISRRSVEK